MTTPEEGARLAAEGWIKHDGDLVPVAADAMIDIRFFDGETVLNKPARWWRWSEAITHYRVVTPAQAEPAPVPADTLYALDALKPFAELGQYVIDTGLTTKPDEVGVFGLDCNTLTYGDFRRAAKAYAMLAERARK